MISIKKPAPIEGSGCGLSTIDIELSYYQYQYNALRERLADSDSMLTMYRDGYEHILWLYADGVSRTSLERREYLMSVELQFLLQPAVFVDLNQLVNKILGELSDEHMQEVRNMA